MGQTDPATQTPALPQAHTLEGSAQIEGIGVHSGQSVTLSIHPAKQGAGITFIRKDLDNQEIPARWDTVVDTRNCTTIGNENGATVSTIEHLMGAFAAWGVEDARVELNGPEMPIMDGSALPFLELVDRAGVKASHSARRILRILKTITVEGDDGRKAQLSPCDIPTIDVAFSFHGRVNFPDQHFSYAPLDDTFSTQIAPARTFGLLEDAEKIKALGLAKGASLENTVVYDKDKIINPEGLRFEDECVRHKILDVVGDFHLAGGLIWGRYQGTHTGHTLNNQLLREVLADTDTFEIE